MWDATASEGLTYNVIDADGHVLEPLICGGVQRTSIDASRSCMWARGRGPKTRYNSSPARSQIPRGEMSDNMTMAEWAAMLWQLIFADDPAEITRLEALLEGTQTEAVDEFIEQSCWSEDVPRFVGGKGTAAERREALRAAYRAQNAKGDR